MTIFDRVFHFVWQKAVKARPRLVGFAEKPFFYSRTGRKWNTEYGRGVGGWFPCSNHSFGYHGLLQQFWNHYGLGSKALLVSETVQVAAEFKQAMPQVDFISTDYYMDLYNHKERTHLIWNLYEEPPADLKISSIICQATFEHLIDPVGVSRRFGSVLADGGHLFVHTHTPLFPYHPWPKDYLRFHPEWFTDLPQIVNSLEVEEVICIYGHAFAVYRKTGANA